MRRAILALVLAILLACSADVTMQEEQAYVEFDDPVNRWCGSCLTCDLKKLPRFTTNSERFDSMFAKIHAAIDTSSAEGHTTILSVCMTENGLAMVGILKFKDGHIHTWVDHTVVTVLDNTTGIGD